MAVFNEQLMIDSLILDYAANTEKRDKAIFRCNTEYVADLDKRLRKTRAELDAALEAQAKDRLDVAMESRQAALDVSTGHELIRWADAGYPPVVGHEIPPRAQDEYIVPVEPTAADWQRAARRYVETGSKEHYKLMLTMVRLDHPVPSLSMESEPAKTTSKKPMTLADLWYGCRWYLLIFTIWAISIVVGINLFT